VDQQLENRIATHLQATFFARQLQIHRKYELEGPRVSQHVGGRKNVAIRLGSAYVVTEVGHVDLITRDASGNIIRDSKAERIAEHTALLGAIGPKAAVSPVLLGLLKSYSRAVSDPSNELVYLYEIRDALSKHHRGEADACTALNISGAEWRRLGVLANVEPLDQGQHRGEHVAGRRDASAAELNEARSIVVKWITAFASTIET
jgi:hypothetical protein